MNKVLALTLCLIIPSPSFAAYRRSRPWGIQKPTAGSKINWNNPITKNLQVYFLLSENGGYRITTSVKNTAIDATVISANATLGNAWGPGKFGNTFNGSGATNERMIKSAYTNFTLPLTISCWVWMRTVPANNNGTVNDQYSMFTQSSAAGAVWSIFVLYNPAKTVQFGSSGGAGDTFTNSAGTIPLQTWTHVVYRVTSAGVQNLFFNGKKDANSPSNQSGTLRSGGSGGQWNYFGAWEGIGRYIDGMMDNCAIWNRALSDAEIQALYETPYLMVSPTQFNFITPVAGAPATMKTFGLEY